MKNIRKKYIVTLSFILAFAGFPFKWIQYKGTHSISIFQIPDVKTLNLFYDLTTLSINFFIFYFIFYKIGTYMNKSEKQESGKCFS